MIWYKVENRCMPSFNNLLYVQWCQALCHTLGGQWCRRGTSWKGWSQSNPKGRLSGFAHSLQEAQLCQDRILFELIISLQVTGKDSSSWCCARAGQKEQPAGRSEGGSRWVWTHTTQETSNWKLSPPAFQTLSCVSRRRFSSGKCAAGIPDTDFQGWGPLPQILSNR